VDKTIKNIKGDIVAKGVVAKCRMGMSVSTQGVTQTKNTTKYIVKIIVAGLDNYLTARVNTADYGTNVRGNADTKNNMRLMGYGKPYKTGDEVYVAFDYDTKGYCAILNEEPTE
jgi:hypothetical protein